MKNTPLTPIQYSKDIKKIKINRRIFIFLVCLCISTFAWLFLSLKKDYQTTIDLPIKQYISDNNNTVENRNELPDKLTLTIYGNGFEIARNILFKKKNAISIDLTHSKNTRQNNNLYKVYYTNSQLQYFSKQIGKNITVLKIYPDSLQVKFGLKKSIVANVEITKKLTFENQYDQDGDISISPSKITVKGPASILDTIKKIYTEPLNLENLNQTKKQIVAINSIYKKYGLEFSSEKFNVTIPVDKFTEKTIAVPVEVLNLPSEIGVKIFPEEVSVSFLISIGRYDKVDAKMFRIGIDYTDLEGLKEDKIDVDIFSKPSFVKELKVKPERLEFLIIK